MITCDKCNKGFKLEPKVKKYSKDIQELYFRCPYCKKRYSSYFTDNNIRKQQIVIRNTKDKEELKRLQNVLKYDMDNLKAKMIGTQ